MSYLRSRLANYETCSCTVLFIMQATYIVSISSKNMHKCFLKLIHLTPWTLHSLADCSELKGKEIFGNLLWLWSISLYLLPFKTLLWRISGKDYEHSKTEISVGQPALQTGVYISNSGGKKGII